MRLCHVGSRIAVLCLLLILGFGISSTSAMVLRRDGTLNVAGHALRCGTMRNVLDPRLPGLGLAAPGVVVFNPRLINRQSNTVRLFVFYHECGHHHVGGSETGADCWAAKQGVRQGWLKREALTDVCRSFGNGPATSTHPAGAVRCSSLQQCFTTAVAEQERRSKQAAKTSVPPATDAAAPALVSGPSLVHDGSGNAKSQE